MAGWMDIEAAWQMAIPDCMESGLAFKLLQLRPDTLRQFVAMGCGIVHENGDARPEPRQPTGEPTVGPACAGAFFNSPYGRQQWETQAPAALAGLETRDTPTSEVESVEDDCSAPSTPSSGSRANTEEWVLL